MADASPAQADDDPDTVPYGLRIKDLDQAPPAAHAVASRLSHIVCDTEYWGRVEISALFLNMTVFSTWANAGHRRKMYHMVCRPEYERALFAGLDALDLDLDMTAGEREAIQQVRTYRAWREAEDRLIAKLKEHPQL